MNNVNFYNEVKFKLVLKASGFLAVNMLRSIHSSSECKLPFSPLTCLTSFLPWLCRQVAKLVFYPFNSSI